MAPSQGRGGGVEFAVAGTTHALSTEESKHRPSRRGRGDLQARGRQGEGMKKSRSTLVLPKQGEAQGEEVMDARKMGREGQRQVVNRVLGGDNTNPAPLLQKMRERLDRVGLQSPTITVRYRQLCVVAGITVGDRSLPSLGKTVSRKLEPLKQRLGRGPPRVEFSIIDGACGVLPPSVFTLLLGPPGSGKTTLLRTLAGHHAKGAGLRVTAEELSYNGRGFHQFEVARSAAYISQVDNHFGELTVRETFDFSARCQSSGYNKGLLEEVLRREQAEGVAPDPEVDAYMRAKAFGSPKSNVVVELVTRLLGLGECEDTVVGNEMLRGISGGQKKRVTTGEMVVGPVRAVFADEITTGLDSNTTYQICTALKNYTHVMKATMLVGLLQPQPETYDLFDEVVLLSCGKVCWHGPREDVLSFFEGLGFRCPERRGVADFLQEVTTPSDQQKYAEEGVSEGDTAPRFVTSRMIQDAFHATPAWRRMEAQLAEPFREEEPGGAQGALGQRRYGQSYWGLFLANLRRVWTLTKRSKVFAIARTTQVVIMALVVATLFWREGTSSVEDGNLFLGVLFYSQLYMLVGAITEMHLLIDRQRVFFKQRDMRFFPGWSYALPTFLLRVPFSLMEATLWTYIVYFIVGFDPSVRVLMFWLLLFLQSMWSISLFQTIAAVCRNDTVATAVGSFFMLVFFNTGGFILNKDDIPPWWIGAYWANPFGWITHALAVNEFTSDQWDRPNPANPSSTLGRDVLRFRGFEPEYWWVWVAVAYSIASLLINVLVCTLAATFLPAPRPSNVISPEALEEVAMLRASQPPGPTQPHVRPGVEAQRVEAHPAGPGDHPPDLEAGLGSPPLEGGSASGSGTSGSPRSRPSPRGVLEGGRQGGGFAQKGLPGTDDQLEDGAAGGGLELPAREASLYGPDDEWLRRGSFLLRASQRASFSAHQAQGYQQDTAIPYQPLALTFKNVTYSVPLPKGADASKAGEGGEGLHRGQLRLIKDISGAFRPGVLSALMGASGSGKTTLMDVLAGRKTGGTTSGEIRVNGHPKEDATLARVMGYVEQNDVHLPQTTVEEACHFSAHLRLPTTVDADTRVRFVEEMMSVVELTRLRHAHVGTPGVSGLSVEQRKRLTIAVELVANPSIVFMDEPTSGLDARAAGVVMGAVRNTVDTGRTVVCTIHQPSLDIFEAFDELLLLKAGGRTIYNGAMGDDSQRLVDFFQGVQGVEHIKPRYNPATWMLEVTSPEAEAELGVDFADIYQHSDLAKEFGEVIDRHHEPAGDSQPLSMADMHVSPAPTQFALCLHRFFRMYWRSPEYNITRFAVTILIGFVFGSLFWRLGDNRTTVAGVLNIAGVLFSSTLFVGISNCLSVQNIVSVERAVMYRERAAGTYGVLPFSLAQQLVELPYILVQSVLYCSIVYWMIWFDKSAAKFFWFILFFFLTLCYFTFFGVMNVCLTPTVAFGNVLSSFFFGLWNVLCGFLIPEPQIPGWWIWFYWINPVTWTLYGLIVSQLGDFDDQFITDLQGNTLTIPNFLKERFGYSYSMRGPIVAILAGFSIVFALTSGLTLKYFNFQNR